MQKGRFSNNRLRTVNHTLVIEFFGKLKKNLSRNGTSSEMLNFVDNTSPSYMRTLQDPLF
jgi:hypothetical protein